MCLEALVWDWAGPSSSSLGLVKAEELPLHVPQWLLSNPGAAVHKQ